MSQQLPRPPPLSASSASTVPSEMERSLRVSLPSIDPIDHHLPSIPQLSKELYIHMLQQLLASTPSGVTDAITTSTTVTVPVPVPAASNAASYNDRSFITEANSSTVIASPRNSSSNNNRRDRVDATRQALETRIREKRERKAQEAMRQAVQSREAMLTQPASNAKPDSKIECHSDHHNDNSQHRHHMQNVETQPSQFKSKLVTIGPTSIFIEAKIDTDTERGRHLGTDSLEVSSEGQKIPATIQSEINEIKEINIEESTIIYGFDTDKTVSGDNNLSETITVSDTAAQILVQTQSEAENNIESIVEIDNTTTTTKMKPKLSTQTSKIPSSIILCEEEFYWEIANPHQSQWNDSDMFVFCGQQWRMSLCCSNSSNSDNSHNKSAHNSSINSSFKNKNFSLPSAINATASTTTTIAPAISISKSDSNNKRNNTFILTVYSHNKLYPQSLQSRQLEQHAQLQQRLVLSSAEAELLEMNQIRQQQQQQQQSDASASDLPSETRRNLRSGSTIVNAVFKLHRHLRPPIILPCITPLRLSSRRAYSNNNNVTSESKLVQSFETTLTTADIVACLNHTNTLTLSVILQLHLNSSPGVRTADSRDGSSGGIEGTINNSNDLKEPVLALPQDASCNTTHSDSSSKASIPNTQSASISALSSISNSTANSLSATNSITSSDSDSSESFADSLLQSMQTTNSSAAQQQQIRLQQQHPITATAKVVMAQHSLGSVSPSVVIPTASPPTPSSDPRLKRHTIGGKYTRK